MTDRNRDEPPGIKLVRSAITPAQITEHHIESMAMHSRSRGWLPAVRIKLITEDGAGLVGSMLVDDVIALVEILLTAAERAPLDVAAALRSRALTLHDETA